MSPKKIFLLFLILIFLFAAFIITGALAPNSYSYSKTEDFVDRPDEIWANLTAIEIIPRRKQDVERVEILFVDRGKITWREYMDDGNHRTLRILERDAPERLVIEQFQSTYGITGTWEFLLRKNDNETVVTIKEQSVNMNLWLRGLYTIIGRDILIDREMKSLRVSLFQRLLTAD